MAPLAGDALLELWLAELRANDLAYGTVRRYRSAFRSFLTWYYKEEQPPLPPILQGLPNITTGRTAVRSEFRGTPTPNAPLVALDCAVPSRTSIHIHDEEALCTSSFPSRPYGHRTGTATPDLPLPPTVRLSSLRT